MPELEDFEDVAVPEEAEAFDDEDVTEALSRETHDGPGYNPDEDPGTVLPASDFTDFFTEGVEEE